MKVATSRPPMAAIHWKPTHTLPWLIAAVSLMVLALLARLTGDLMPSTMVRHYIYAAFCWGAGLMIWAGWVLPGIFRRDPEDAG